MRYVIEVEDYGADYIDYIDYGDLESYAIIGYIYSYTSIETYPNEYTLAIL